MLLVFGMRPEIVFKIIFLLFFLLMSNILAADQKNLSDRLLKLSKPTFDDEIGITHQKLISLYGVPDRIHSLRTFRKGDELRSRLEVFFKHSPSLPHVREVVFRMFEGEAFYWQTQNNNGDWIVFSNALIPKGVMF